MTFLFDDLDKLCAFVKSNDVIVKGVVRKSGVWIIKFSYQNPIHDSEVFN